MKKHLAIFTAILTLMLTMVGTVPTLATTESTYAEGQEILVNGDFDTTSDDVVGTTGKFIGGSWKDGGSLIKTSEKIQIVNEEGGAYKGKSVKIVTANPETAVDKATTSPTSLVAEYQNAIPLEGAVTKLSFRIKVESLDTTTNSFVYVCIGNGGIYRPSGTTPWKNRNLDGGKEITQKTDGWVDMELGYPSKNSSLGGANYCLTFHVYGGATVYIDDVSVKEVKEGLLFSTEWENVAAPKTTNKWAATVATDTKLFGSSSHLLTVVDTAATSTTYAMYGLVGRNLLTAGKKYKLSFWYKPVDPNDTTKPFVTIGDGTQNAPTGMTRTDTDLKRTEWITGGVKDGWTEYIAYFTMGEYASQNVTVTVVGLMFIKSGSADSFYIDNFTVKEDTETDVAFYNAAGETVTAVKANDVLTAKAHLLSDKNETEGGRPVQILLARYEKKGNALQCVEVSCENKTVYDEKVMDGRISGAEDVTLSYTVPADTPAGSVIKAFLWDGAGTLKPVGTGMAEITIAAE